MSAEMEALRKQFEEYVKKNDAEIKDIKNDVSNIKTNSAVVNEKLNTIMNTLATLVEDVKKLTKRGLFDPLNWVSTYLIPALIGAGALFLILKAIGKV